MYKEVQNKIAQTYLEIGEIDTLLDSEAQTLLETFGGIDI